MSGLLIVIAECQDCPCVSEDTWPHCAHWEAPPEAEQVPALNHEGCNPVPAWCPARKNPQGLWEYVLNFAEVPT